MSKEALKEYLPNYLESRGVSLKKIGVCLVCNGGHKDPCAGYDAKRNKYHCFSCGIDYDIFDFIALDNNLNLENNFKEVLEIGCREYGIATDSLNDKESSNPPIKPKKSTEAEIAGNTEDKDYTSYYHECHRNIALTKYMIDRGINQQTLDNFLIGYDVQQRCIVIPVTKSFHIKRSVEGKSFLNLKGVPVDVFNKKYLTKEQKEPIFVVESAIDALSIEQMGARAISLNSSTNTRKLIELIDQYPAKNSFIIALDNDEAGERAANALSLQFKERGIPHVLFNVSGDCKDANEALQANSNKLFESIESGKKIIYQELNKINEEYKERTQAARSVGAFFDVIKSRASMSYIPTGFPKLDKMLDGGVYEGLYFIGAISSLGKTTFVLQMSDSIAKSGQDVLIFSLEMSKYELMAKSISRLTFENAQDTRHAKTVRGITNYKRYANYNETELKLIVDSINKYEAEYGGNIYILEGVGDIGVLQVREAVKEHIERTGMAPMVIIDYVQLLAPIDPRMSDKQNTDKSVLELKRISRDYKIPIMGISSLNRDNYNMPISMAAFKESGSIEYSSDVLIGLQAKGIGEEKGFDINKAKAKNPREIELVVLKNRNGATGGKLQYNYYTLFNCFKEV